MIEGTEFDLDAALVWGVSEYNSKEVEETTEENEYILIDNPINRIKDVKY